MSAAPAEAVRRPANQEVQAQDVLGEDAGAAIQALEIYRTRLREILEPEFNGMHLALSVKTGDYEVAPTALDAADRLSLRRPGELFALMEVGHPVREWPWLNDNGPVGAR